MAVAVAGALAAAWVPKAFAVTITVTTNADVLVSDAQCGLGEAIAAANTDAAGGGCPAGAGAGAVLLGPTTYPLDLSRGSGGGELTIPDDLSISGGLAGANTKTFSGRIGRRILKPGAHRATLTGEDAAGNVSKPKRLRFRVVPRRPR